MKHAVSLAGFTAVAALGVVLAVLLPSAQAGPGDADPIVGYWNYGGGVVQVTGGPTSFTGTVVKATVFSTCPHPVGETMWRITKSGSSYTGTHSWFAENNCTPGSAGYGKSTWSIVESGSSYVLHFCTTNPNNSTDTRCNDLTRAKPVKPPATTKPTTTAPPPEWEKLFLEYETPRRFGLDLNKDGLVDYFTRRDQVEPREWTALVTVKRKGGAACDPSATYAWKIGGRPNAFEPLGSCVFVFKHFPRLGNYRVSVTATRGDQKAFGETLITLDDYLIVGLGDSNGSGEGNPDIPGLASPTWEDFRCDRSAQSYQARTASALEKASDQASVTFVHLACSGASIYQGLLKAYRGINDPGGLALPAQVVQMKNLIGSRKPDAVIVSIGINDIGFGPLVAFCIEQDACFAAKGFDKAHPKKDLSEVVADTLAFLPVRYDQIASRLQALGVPAGKVYLTEYMDPTRDSNGKFCNPLISVVGHGRFTRVEAEWAFDEVLVPLNAAVAAAARKHGWNYVNGAQQLFRRHGYCSDDTWIVSLTRSLFSQGLFWQGLGAAKAGTLHANAEGHQIQARRVVAVMRQRGITGKPRTAA